VKPPGTNVERAGEVEFLILARRYDAALLAAQHPVATDLRVEMNVHLVAVEHRLLGARASLEPSNLGQTTLPRVARPGTEDDRLRHAETSADARQGAAHRADRDLGATLLVHLQAEQLACPGRSAPPEVLRRESKKLRDTAPKRIVGLRHAVSVALVVEAGDALRHVVTRSSHNRGARDIKVLGDLRATPPQAQPSHGMEANGRVGIAAAASEVDQVSAETARHPRYLLHAGLFDAWGFGDSQTVRRPRLFPSIGAVDRQSRAVI
jgi:hypothetical protein